MLVLTRKPNEAIVIGEDIKVVLLSIDGDRARIGIEAPQNLRIFRSETVDGIKKENILAASTRLDISALSRLRNRDN